MPKWLQEWTEVMKDVTEYGKVTGWRYLKGILTMTTAGIAVQMDGGSWQAVTVAVLTCWINLIDKGESNDGKVEIKSLDQ